MSLFVVNRWPSTYRCWTNGMSSDVQWFQYSIHTWLALEVFTVVFAGFITTDLHIHGRNGNKGSVNTSFLTGKINVRSADSFTPTTHHPYITPRPPPASPTPHHPHQNKHISFALLPHITRFRTSIEAGALVGFRRYERTREMKRTEAIRRDIITTVIQSLSLGLCWSQWRKTSSFIHARLQFRRNGRVMSVSRRKFVYSAGWLPWVNSSMSHDDENSWGLFPVCFAFGCGSPWYYIAWKTSLRNWPSVRKITMSPVESLHKWSMMQSFDI